MKNFIMFFACQLGVAFIVLKLCNVIAWSWLWVLSPVWIPLAVLIIILWWDELDG